MKKISLLLILMLAALSSCQHKAQKNPSKDVYELKKTGEYTLLSIPMEADSAYTGALDALLTSKLNNENGAAEVTLKIGIGNEGKDLSQIQKIVTKLTYKDLEITRTLEIDSTSEHYAEGIFRFDLVKVKKEGGKTEEIKALLHQLQRRDSIEIAIQPTIDDNKEDWSTVK